MARCAGGGAVRVGESWRMAQVVMDESMGEYHVTYTIVATAIMVRVSSQRETMIGATPRVMCYAVN